MSSVNLSRERSMYAHVANRQTQQLRNDAARLQEQMSTGKRVNRPSDDPTSFGQAKRLDALNDRYAQYQDAIDAAKSWTTHTQERLDRMTDLFASAREKGVRAQNDALSDDDRADLARQIRSFKDETVDQLNTKVGDEYLFAGNRTNAQPFNDDGQPIDATGSVLANYDEINGDRTRRIGPAQELTVNVSGETVHDTGEGYSITEALEQLADAVESGTTADRKDALERVETARDHLTRRGAETGDTARRLSQASEQLQYSSVEVERRRSQEEDADYLETVTAFQQNQTRLQAALQVTAQVQQTSLLNYLQ